MYFYAKIKSDSRIGIVLFTSINSIFHQKYYSIHFKLFECFDWNTNIKKYVGNLWK
jgi:hypothetical protein